MTEETQAADLDEILENEIQDTEESDVQPEEAKALEQEPVEIPEDLRALEPWNEETKQAWESVIANAEYHDHMRPIRAQFEKTGQYVTELEAQRKQLSERAQYADYIDQLTQQFGDVFQGRNPIDVIGNYLYYGQQLAQNPQQTLQALAKEYGVDLNQLVQEQPYVDDYTKQLQNQVEQLQQQFYGQQSQQHEAYWQGQAQRARDFQNETDAKGNLLRPHLPEVMQEAFQLMNPHDPSTWQEAYERACWANPSVRAKLLEEQANEQKQQQRSQAEKAKSSLQGQPKRSKSSVTAPSGAKDLDEAIEAGFADAEAAAA